MYTLSNFLNWIDIADVNKFTITKPTQRVESLLYLNYKYSSSVDNLVIEVDKGTSYFDCSIPITSDYTVPSSSTSIESDYLLNNFDIDSPESTVLETYTALNTPQTRNYPIYNALNNKYISNIDIDLNLTDNTGTVSFYGVPYGTQKFIRFNNNSLSSYLINKPINTFILPNTILNNTVNNVDDIQQSSCNLYEWALGLLTLIELKQDVLIYKSLNYIYLFYLAIKDKTDIPGFPDNLNESFITDSDKQRSIINNAWAGFAILQALGYLSNRPQESVVKLPYLFKELIENIVNLINTCTNINNGTTIVGIDEYGGYINHSSPDNSYISSVFLNQVLCYFYTENTHLILERIQNYCIQFIQTDTSKLNYTNNEEFVINTYKLYWILYYQRNFDSLSLILNRLKAITNVQLDFYHLTVYAYKKLKLTNRISSSLYISEYDSFNRQGTIDDVYIPFNTQVSYILYMI
jgi:hypothetical protein